MRARSVVVSIWATTAMSEPSAFQTSRLSVAVIARSATPESRSCRCAVDDGTVAVDTSSPAAANSPLRRATSTTAGTTNTDWRTLSTPPPPERGALDDAEGIVMYAARAYSTANRYETSSTEPSSRGAPVPQDYEVVVVGGGPVGVMALALLGHAGISAVGIEREATLWPQARAVHFDGEIVRAFQSIGLGEDVFALCKPDASTSGWRTRPARR